MSRILLTGIAGFIGANVAEFLLGQGHQVIGVDNLNDSYDVRLKRWRLEQLKNHKGLTIYCFDITDSVKVEKLFSEYQFDAIINLAARAGVRQSIKDPWAYIETNVKGTLSLLEACRRFGVKKFIQASTSSLYGGNGKIPWAENTSSDQLLSPYACTKKSAELLCYNYHYLYNLNVTIFRYFTVYGPAGRPDMSPYRFVKWITEGEAVVIFGDGSQSRDFTYVSDIARGTVAGLDLKGFQTLNLGSDRPFNLMEVIRLFEQLIQKRAKLSFHLAHSTDAMQTWADISEARKLLGWEPMVPFEEGAKKLVTWYLDNQEWAKEIALGD